MDSVFANLGLSGWKPVFAALALPPVPFLLLAVIAARLMASRHHWRSGLTLMFGVVAMLWLSCCIGVGNLLEQALLRVPPPLSEARIAALKREATSGKVVVLVLGGGRERLAPEYGESHLSARSMQRLHYGIWVARRINAPMMFSGGTGFAQPDGPAEADIAARIAARDYGRPLRWVETASRDTRGNAAASIGMLKPEGVTDIILVTHGWHMSRSMRAFEEAARRNDMKVQLIAAPMGLASLEERAVLRWLPSQEGFAQVRQALRELLGLTLGA